MLEHEKQFWIGTLHDGKKEVIWNWSNNMHAGIYPEYASIDGPFNSRENAMNKAGLKEQL